MWLVWARAEILANNTKQSMQSLFIAMAKSNAIHSSPVFGIMVSYFKWICPNLQSRKETKGDVFFAQYSIYELISYCVGMLSRVECGRVTNTCVGHFKTRFSFARLKSFTWAFSEVMISWLIYYTCNQYEMRSAENFKKESDTWGPAWAFKGIALYFF